MPFAFIVAVAEPDIFYASYADPEEEKEDIRECAERPRKILQNFNLSSDFSEFQASIAHS